MPTAHLSVIAEFRRAEVNISSFIVCVHGERISVCLRGSARCFFGAIVRVRYSRFKAILRVINSIHHLD